MSYVTDQAAVSAAHLRELTMVCTKPCRHCDQLDAAIRQATDAAYRAGQEAMRDRCLLAAREYSRLSEEISFFAPGVPE